MTVLHDWKGTQEEHIDLVAGEKVLIQADIDSEWCRVKPFRLAKAGLAPASCLTKAEHFSGASGQINYMGWNVISFHDAPGFFLRIKKKKKIRSEFSGNRSSPCELKLGIMESCEGEPLTFVVEG